MGKIHKLSPHLADMIAAGEVVERPASVVKELVENAVDAGATQILVEIKHGGITFIRVTDNGAGIAPEDAPTAFLRHATSKIKTSEDLGQIVTMGFRGEALAAISAVSKIDLITKEADREMGCAVRVEAGNVLDVSEAGCPQGTTIIVRDLFYNTPARMKFLKRDSVEGGFAGGAVQRQALSHPEIAFRLIRDGKQELSTPGDGKLLSAIYAAMGRQCAKEMIPVEGNASGVTIRGYVGLPTANRGTRGYQHFFVNGRYVKSVLLSKALEEGYKNQMMVGRFPICVIHVTIPPAAVDVNVHPAKTEVKFLREGDVFDALHYTVLGALRRAEDRPEVTIPAQNPKPQRGEHPTNSKTPFFQTMDAETYRSLAADMGTKPVTEQLFAALSRNAERKNTNAVVRDSARMTPVGERPAPMPPMPPVGKVLGKTPVEPSPAEVPVQTRLPLPKIPAPSPERAFPEEFKTAKTEETPPYRIIGQTMDTYIMVEQGDSLLFIDKHAAHERILFERLKAQNHEIMSQMLLRPLQVQLSQEAAEILLEKGEELEGLGFTVEDYGGGRLAVRAIPAALDEGAAAICLETMAQDYLDGARLSPAAVYDNLLHTIACKAAIKGGRKTDPIEITALVAEVMERDDIQHCPHGRPVCITLTRAALERQFKRT